MAQLSRITYSSDMPKVVPLTEARASLSELLDSVEREHEQVVITRNGKPVALLVSPDEWESMEETIEVLSDPELMAALEESERDVQAGRVYTLEDVKRDLGLA
jgi:antitoxin YefM